MKKLKVNDDCICCGACVQIDPEDFRFKENGQSEAINEEISEDNTSAIEAMESCPVEAIEITDSENK